ncbi:YaaR family protein [Brevibacillus ruminantium]|uniref:YaaR family protein n=1 Tax=Brevibacillus ruminantium TaxID=2950604 RepID=A0ABY4WE29_9BACL|nr:YaaR family protein [Brevibacillus ruminantium]USG65313.1 YaaR family protein [Brevibacillus ruminantium]
MEVNKIGQLSVEQRKAKHDVPADRVVFSELMNKGRNQLNAERLQKLVVDIEEQGKILADSRTVGDLRKFKSLVKSLLDDAVKNGLKLEEQQGFNRRGRSRVFKVVKEVDQKLLELTDAVLKNQEPGLRILERVGEIKGLVLNIFV